MPVRGTPLRRSGKQGNTSAPTWRTQSSLPALLRHGRRCRSAEKLVSSRSPRIPFSTTVDCAEHGVFRFLRCWPAQSCPLHVRRPVSVSISERGGYTATHTVRVGCSRWKTTANKRRQQHKSYSGLGCDRRSICRGRVSGTKDARRICMVWYWPAWGHTFLSSS